MTPETADLVRQSWAAILPRRKQVCMQFYRRLFAADPAVRPLFKQGLERQTALFVTMINTVVSALENPEPVVPLIKTLGVRHARYGVSDGDYDRFVEVLLETFADAQGDAFTPQVREAWREVYGRLADTMRAGAAEQAA